MLVASPATVPAVLQALSYCRSIATRCVSTKNEVSSQKIGPKVFHKGDYSEQFLSRVIVRALGFTDSATPVNHHAFLAIFIPLRQNHPNTSFAGICVKEKWFSKIRQALVQISASVSNPSTRSHIQWSTQTLTHVQSAGRAASRSLRNPEHTDSNI